MVVTPVERISRVFCVVQALPYIVVFRPDPVKGIKSILSFDDIGDFRPTPDSPGVPSSSQEACASKY